MLQKFIVILIGRLWKQPICDFVFLLRQTITHASLVKSVILFPGNTKLWSSLPFYICLVIDSWHDIYRQLVFGITFINFFVFLMSIFILRLTRDVG